MDERRAIYDGINEAVKNYDWYTIIEIVKADSTGYALHTLAVFACKQKHALTQISSFVQDYTKD